MKYWTLMEICAKILEHWVITLPTNNEYQISETDGDLWCNIGKLDIKYQALDSKWRWKVEKSSKEIHHPSKKSPAPDLWSSFSVGDVLHYLIVQYFTSILNLVPDIWYSFWWMMEFITHIPIIHHKSAWVPNIWYSFLVGNVITQCSNISSQISMSTWYFIFILSGQCNQLPYLPIFHKKSPPVPDISHSFLVGDEITLFSNISPQIFISAQYFIFIFSGWCNQFPNFPMFHYKSPWVPNIWYSFLVGNVMTWFSNMSPQIKDGHGWSRYQSRWKLWIFSNSTNCGPQTMVWQIIHGLGWYIAGLPMPNNGVEI